MIRCVLTDIEGTTSSLAFVKETLFPYARSKLADFVRTHREEPQVAAIVNAVATEVGRPLSLEKTIEQLIAWIDQDLKITPLKNLQGLIWASGYENGDFKGHVYEDASRQLRHWHQRGLKLAIFSSGSVNAQKLLFAHSDAGDLTPLFTAYFDTTTGAKQSPEAYERIAQVLGNPPGEILFLSDIEAELDAARASGFKTRHLIRDRASEASGRHPVAHHFDEIVI